jgi:indolepyruvate ferredoxin oxidoreductase beta subunit
MRDLSGMKTFNIVLAGVGGQGILLAAEIIGTAAVEDGLNVRVSEIHGMAQRGGAVTSTVRIGDDVFAPTVMEGQADMLVGFEPLETLRNLLYCSKKTHILLSDERIPPPELAAKNLKYPEMNDILERIKSFSKRICLVKTSELAKKAGSALTQNVVLVGASAGLGVMPIKTESLLEALRILVPPKHVEANVKGFTLGYEITHTKQR